MGELLRPRVGAWFCRTLSPGTMRKTNAWLKRSVGTGTGAAGAKGEAGGALSLLCDMAYPRLRERHM